MNTRDQGSFGAWLRTFGLSGVMVGVLIGVQGFLSPPAAFRPMSLPPATVKANAEGGGLSPRTLVSWRLDHALSLHRLHQAHPQGESLIAAPLALSPDRDESGEQDGAGTTQNQDHVGVQVALGAVDAPMMIDPPAAGRASRPVVDVQAQYRRAHDLVEQGQDASALALLRDVLKADPHHLVARRLAIALAMDLQQSEQAQLWLTEGLTLHPTDATLRTIQARQLSHSGEIDEAIRVLAGIEHPDAEAMGLKAGLLVKVGAHAQAVAAYEQALKSMPDNATWWLGLGVSWQAQGQVAAAKDAFARALRLGQLSPDLQTWLEQQM